MNLDAVQMNSFSADQCMVPDPNDVILETESMPSYEAAYSYDELFPSLPENEPKPQPETPLPDLGQWSQRMKLKSSVITQVFRVPVEERRFRDMNSQHFGEQGEQAKICAVITHKTGAHIEISSSKDQSLTVLVTGKEEAVRKARRLISKELQTQASINIAIPRQYHRFILGKGGKTLSDMEKATDTNIFVPRPEENSDLIKINGTKDSIEKAQHAIQLISDEQSKKAFERLPIPKVFHPFILGPYKEQMKKIMDETGATINIPPVSVMKDELSISGEKEAVALAKDWVMRIYKEKENSVQVISVEVPKNQHKHIIGHRGKNIQEILADTGVSVEIPGYDVPSDTVILRGEQEKLGNALTLVYAKANSVKTVVVEAPSWLHKYIIGRKGANIKEISEDYSEVHIEFADGQDQIKVEGPPADIAGICKELQHVINDLQSRFIYEEISVDPAYHRHIIGKNGANIKKIKQDSDVQIHIPTDETARIIRIEGCLEDVRKAKKELLDMVYKMENEVVREVTLEQRFHRNIIGTGGGNIKATRDRFNQVNITFPEPGKRSDKVILRGPKDDVNACAEHLVQIYNELKLNNFQEEVPINKQNHKFIIGKGGANIRKIREETNTIIDLPAEGSDSDIIKVRGRKEDVLSAKHKLMNLEKQQDDFVSLDLMIPSELHNSIIGAKGRTIRSVVEDCGGVTITFPTENCGSDKVLIRGVKEDAQKAKKRLLELSNEKQITGFTEKIKARPEHHKFLIGKQGSNIKKIREKTNAKITFPNTNDEDRDTITITGRKEEVLAAKKELLAAIEDLDKNVEITISVDPKHHRHFVSRGGEVVRQIGDEFGGVSVSFPRVERNSDIVTVKGLHDDVIGAKKKILEIVADLDTMITVECVIPQKFHRTMMGSRGSKVQNLQQEYHVQIKFPEKDKFEDGVNEDEPAMNGDYNDGSEYKKCDIVLVTGKLENCEAAKQALIDAIPITEEVEVPFEFHRFIIGQKGLHVREMMSNHDVNISIPHQSEQSNFITITGSPMSIESAKLELEKKIEQLEADKLDRVLQSFQLSFEVDPQYHPKIIGKLGAVITKIKDLHRVKINFPERDASNQSVITVIGYEQDAEAAKADILKIVQEQEEMYREEICIDPRCHSRIIGTRGRNISKIMAEFHVEIRFPRGTGSPPDIVTISGAEEDVLDVKDQLFNLEEECLQDIREQELLRTYTCPPSRQGGEKEYNHPKEFVVTGAPWDQRGGSGKVVAPDTNDTEEFPSFGTPGDPPSKPVAWGPQRR